MLVEFFLKFVSKKNNTRIIYTTKIDNYIEIYRNLLPQDISKFSKDDICEYLLDLYLPKAQKYESIFFDCRDPHINKRNILNTAMIMGLGGIIPKDVTKLSKDDVCKIINNYINVLKETKELKLAK